MKSAIVWQGGYTIVEVMIFLVISSALLIGAIGLFGGKIQRTEFTQSVQNLATQLQTTANEVSTGTYDTSKPFDCTYSGGTVTTAPTSGPSGDAIQGTRSQCVFLGKVMNFDSSDDPLCVDPADPSSLCDHSDIYTVVGRRLANDGTSVVTSLLGSDGAKPTLVKTPNITGRYDYQNDTHVTAVFQKASASQPAQPVSGLALLQSFGGTYTGSSLGSGAQNVQVWYIQKTPPNSAPVGLTEMNNLVTTSSLFGPNPSQPLVICLISGDNTQNASITLDPSNGGLNPVVTMGDNQCPTA